MSGRRLSQNEKSLSLLDRMEEIEAQHDASTTSDPEAQEDGRGFSDDTITHEGEEEDMDEEDADEDDDESSDSREGGGRKLFFTNFAPGDCVSARDDDDEDDDEIGASGEEEDDDEGFASGDDGSHFREYEDVDPQSASGSVTADSIEQNVDAEAGDRGRSYYESDTALNVLYEYEDNSMSAYDMVGHDAFGTSSALESNSQISHSLSSSFAGKHSSFASNPATHASRASFRDEGNYSGFEPRPSFIQQRRRVTINEPRNPPGHDSSIGTAASSRILGGGGHDNSSSSLLSKMRSRAPLFKPMAATARSILQRRSNASSRTSSGDGSGPLELNDALDRLGNHGTTDLEKTSAAAALVALTTNVPTNRKTVQFGQGDNVLVPLTYLNITNLEDHATLFTVDPVNLFGYPAGEGKSEEQRQGPFKFLLCTVSNVHFDEDERYYTVVRADTGSEQRADPPLMEPIRDIEGIKAAMKAAERTRQSEFEVARQQNDITGFLSCVSDLMSVPLNFFRNKIIPCYVRTRNVAKIMVANLLDGAPGYAIRSHLTCINVLVICSFIFLFIDSFSIAFLDATSDRAIAILGVVVWFILALELIFEFLIRPSGYHQLIKSEKAFAPATARHVNKFHLLCESIALLLFTTYFPCAFSGKCGDRSNLSSVRAGIDSVMGSSPSQKAYGRFVIGLTFLRAFGLVRHWKQMWINLNFEEAREYRNPIVQLLVGRDASKNVFRMSKRNEDIDCQQDAVSDDASNENEADQQLKNAANIGTALMLVNSHRALLLFLFIVTVFPMVYTMDSTNHFILNEVALLQAYNLAANSTSDCDFLYNAILSWRSSALTELTEQGTHGYAPFVLFAQILPVRCDWQQVDGVITLCDFVPSPNETDPTPCTFWNKNNPQNVDDASPAYYSQRTRHRAGGIMDIKRETLHPSNFIVNETLTSFEARAIFDENHSLEFAMVSLFTLMFTTLILTLLGLSVLRGDAGRLVLDPLKRMLKIVVRYAENPLSENAPKKTVGRRRKTQSGPEDKSHGDTSSKGRLGNFETEKLITAISKIADLLRMCWGVAGAGIISSNLARTSDGATVVFNPTVPGKRVYAIFGFVLINGFSKLLKGLDNDVMILINDVARVVHEEVYRWALRPSGQCNKNLGNAFLMVFRIGDFSEVHDKKKRATDVVFNSHTAKNVKMRQRSNAKASTKRGAGGRKTKRSHNASSRHFDVNNDGTLQLATLPGIDGFTDRALLSFLKSYAGIHRDRRLQNWKKDFRLGGGVGVFQASVLYGMDAGWAVEGAVGSEYKIDATYLSPHVNMASRMMSATKQYGVTILLSQAVEELLSVPARKKLRHLDTVYVKGSSVAQRIFTYDARQTGVDFFLFDRSPEQAEIEAASYSQAIWEVDQDLRAMRQHVTDEFMEKFKVGVEQYLEGNWKKAVETLQEANNMMIQAVLEEGYVEINTDADEDEILNDQTKDEEIIRIRDEFGDGACTCLIQYMQRRRAMPPADWNGVRHLMSK